MEITQTQLQRFIVLYKKELGISLTPVEAQQKALSLLRFLAVSITPLENIKRGDMIEKSDVGR